MVRRILVCGGLAAFLLPASGEAAVRVCQPAVTSGPQAAATVGAGQRLAIQAWMASARAIGGDNLTSWRLAVNKSVSCKPGADNKIICTAVAEPCSISQVPMPAPGASPARPKGSPAAPPEPKVIPVPQSGPGKPVNI